jgi:uncharacterized repeat protein (TIGR04076 family)
LHRIIITVEKIEGRCPVFQVGEKMVVEYPRLRIERSDKICCYALCNMLHILTAFASLREFFVDLVPTWKLRAYDRYLQRKGQLPQTDFGPHPVAAGYTDGLRCPSVGPGSKGICDAGVFFRVTREKID